MVEKMLKQIVEKPIGLGVMVLIGTGSLCFPRSGLAQMSSVSSSVPIEVMPVEAEAVPPIEAMPVESASIEADSVEADSVEPLTEMPSADIEAGVSADIPEEILRTEIITAARSPLTGEPLTAAEYAQLIAELEAPAGDPMVSQSIEYLVFLLQIRRALKPILPFIK